MRSENMAKIALHTVQCLSCFSSGIQLPAYKDTTEFTVCRSFNDVWTARITTHIIQYASHSTSIYGICATKTYILKPDILNIMLNILAKT